MRVGFIGAGSMASAMARGWASGEGGPSSICFFDVDTARAAELASEVGGQTADDARALTEAVDLVILAVKPAALEAVAEGTGSSAPALLSMLGATSIDAVSGLFPAVPVVRLIPNQAVEVRQGVLCLTVADGVSEELRGEVMGLLEVLGHTVELDEGLLDAATAVMSCSPAYLALIAGALASAGERQGLEHELAGRLVAESLAGTGALLRGREPDAVRGAVATPGGITEAGLRVLESAGVDSAIEKAVEVTMEEMTA